jgi:FkbM family methyltransferase
MRQENYSLLKCKNGFFWLENSDMISKVMRFYGEWAENSIEVMRLFLEKGDVAIDVGANIGTITMALAETVGESGKVYAYEGQRRIFYNLCTNIMLNSKFNIFASRSLIGDKKGHLILTDQFDQLEGRKLINRGSISFTEQMKSEIQPEAGCDKINMNTLDDELENLDSVNLIKIDTEGAEPAVLRGAAKIIRRHYPVVYLECGSEKLYQDEMPLLKSLGYRCYWHAALHYRNDNYFNCGNITGHAGDLNIVALPPNIGLKEVILAKYNLKECRDWAQIKREFVDFRF